MPRLPIPILFVCAVVLAGCVGLGRFPSEVSREVVEKAEGTLSRFKDNPDFERMRFGELMAEARGVVILPTVIKAGFFGGAEGGNGVLLTRGGGEWSHPAFYTLGAASFGLQVGLQDVEMVMVLRSEGAVEAILEHQGKFGADAGITVGVIGAGLEGSTTANLGADVVVYANAVVGLFGGISVEGAALIRRNDLNEAYYNGVLTPRQIVIERTASNPAADGLRSLLASF